jgi:type IV pilus assembly protein PilM
MAKRIVTLFIRETSINLLVMRGKRVEKWASSPLEPGLVAQGVIQDEAQVADKVKELFKLQKVGGRVIAGLGAHNSLYRLITLPEMPDALLHEAVRREAKRVLPISLDEVYLAYQSIPAPRGEKRIFLATYPRNMADALLKTLRQAGIEPYLMDLAPLALSLVPDQPRAIVLNAGFDHADIIVIEERLPQLIRVVSLPSEANSLAEKLPAISEELNRTVVFYNSSHMEKPLNPQVPVYVAGELAEAPDSWPSLVGTLGYPVSALPVPVEQPEGFPANDFSVNIGLALKELAQERDGENFSAVNLNTLPVMFQRKPVPVAAIVAPIAVIVGLGLLGYMGFMIRNTSAHTEALRSQLAMSEKPIAQTQDEIAKLKLQVTQAEPQAQPVQTETGQIKAVTTVFNSTLAALETSRAESDKDLHTVVSLLPTNVDLTQVNYGASAVVTGMAADESGVFAYTRALRSSGGVNALIISTIQTSGDGVQQYQFQVLLK